MERYTLHFDGSCGPKNPGGTAAYGFVLSKDGVEIESGHAVIGTGPGMSNNLAEFAGLTAGLKAFQKCVQSLPTAGRWQNSCLLDVYGDSQLVVNVMSGRWRAKPDKLYYQNYLKALCLRDVLEAQGRSLTFRWIPREQNTLCDDLSKAHLVSSASGRM